TVENAKSLLISRFFDPKRYDLAYVGRYKMNKKLHIKNRLFNQILAEPLVDKETGEVLAEKGDKLDRKLLNKIIPHLEKDEDKLTEETAELTGGILEETMHFQQIKIIDP